MIGSLKRKCGTCGERCVRKDMYKINMKLADGKKTVLICETCAKQLLVSEHVISKNLGVKDE